MDLLPNKEGENLLPMRSELLTKRNWRSIGLLVWGMSPSNEPIHCLVLLNRVDPYTAWFRG
jgi:hypothetical protein